MLSQEQERIGQLLQAMPAELVREVLDFTLFLKEKRQRAKPIDDSTEWTEEDMRDCTRNSMEYLLTQFPDEDEIDDAPTSQQEMKPLTPEATNV